MESFSYRKSADILALSASITDFAYKKHCHEEYALGVTLRGVQQYTLDGSFQSSTPGGVMLFNREQYHDGSAFGKEGIDYFMLYLKQELVSDVIGKKELRFHSPIVYDRRLASAICAVSRAVQQGQAEALCNELLLELVEAAAQTSASAPSRQGGQLVNKAREVIYSQLGGTLKLEELSSEFGMSRFQLIREFKARTGISPYQYFLNAKVGQARLSIERSRDVYAAVAEFGFTDLTHLNRHFKSMFGITAHEYRLQLGS